MLQECQYQHTVFPHTARLWDSLPVKCFPLIYALSQKLRHLFQTDFLYTLILPFSGCMALHGVNLSWKKNCRSSSILARYSEHLPCLTVFNGFSGLRVRLWWPHTVKRFFLGKVFILPNCSFKYLYIIEF